MVEAIGRGIDTTVSSLGDAPVAVPEAICLTYSKAVIDLHQQGLSAEEIQRVLDHAKRSPQRELDAGADSDDALESLELCGPPADVLRAAGMERAAR